MLHTAARKSKSTNAAELRVLPHRPPFLFVDRVMKLDPYKSIVAERRLAGASLSIAPFPAGLRLTLEGKNLFDVRPAILGHLQPVARLMSQSGAGTPSADNSTEGTILQ